jgi:hypothetical protein
MPRGKVNKNELPAVILKRSDIPIDRKKVKKYAAVCGYRLSDEFVPPTYPHIMAFALHMEILLDRKFPFPIMGMVHINNTITCYKPVPYDARLTIEVYFEEMVDHDKGKVIPMVTKIYNFGELVWESRSENLKRIKQPGDMKKKKKSPKPAMEGERQTWKLDNFAGIRYAFTGGAGDFNPIHLMPVTAKPFGFNRHIIHGMWTKARCVAALQDEIGERPFTVRADFKLPVFLPAKVTFTKKTTAEGIDFEVRDQWNEKPHLTGTVRYL